MRLRGRGRFVLCPRCSKQNDRTLAEKEWAKSDTYEVWSRPCSWMRRLSLCFELSESCGELK